MNRAKIIKADDITCTTEASIPIIRQTGDTVAIQPNTLNVWGRVISLSLTLATPDSALDMNVYMAQFTSGQTPTVLTLPDNILWLSSPVINADRIYRLTIINNLATIEDYEAMPEAMPEAYNYISGTYNITSTELPVIIIGLDFSLSNISRMWIDGIEITPTKKYTFTTTGNHTVRIEVIEGLESAKYMFSGLGLLTSLDFSSFNSSSLTDMSFMLSSSSLVELDLTPLNASNVTELYGTFSRCSSLKTVKLPPLNKVTSLNGTFANCESLESLDLSPLDISNVVDTNYTFINCSNLTSFVPFYNWKRANLDLSYSPISALAVHQLIERSASASEGAIARTLILNTTTKTNWQNSQYYQEDSAMALSKNITIK